MKKLLAFCLPVLLLVSCGGASRSRLTLIFENAPENARAIYASDTVNPGDKFDIAKLFWFDGDYTWGEFIPSGSYDTLRVNCGSSGYLELSHYYRRQTNHYALLRAGDTVYVRYGEDGTPSYRSSLSDELTILYNADILLFGKPPADFKDELYYNIRRSTSQEEIRKKGKPRKYWYPPLDSLLLAHEQNVQRGDLRIDSLAKAGLMPAEYEKYYRYRLRLLCFQPELARLISPPAAYKYKPSDEILAFLNDDLCCYFSYNYIAGTLVMPLVADGGSWQVPLTVVVDEPNYKVTRAEEGEVFDRLALFADKIPPKTLNVMRYDCLMVMKNNPQLQFTQEYQQKYFEKYRRITTDFLTPEYIPIQDTMRFPFRFFVFLLELMVCMGAFWAIYLALIRNRVGFLASRIYLLAALALSVLIPSLMLPVHIAMLPDSALYWDSIVGQFLYRMLYLYLLGCVLMLAYFAWQLYRLRNMWKNSWRIPGGSFTLCILTEEEVRPFAFLRSVFFSWSDWWEVRSEESRNHILAHELAHLKAWHSIDNILVALGRILYWANPLLLTYGKELRRVNEFAADLAVTRTYDKASYRQTIRSFGLGLPKMASVLVNSNDKAYADRIGKLEAKAIPWYKNGKVLVLVPLAILLMLLLSGELLVNLGKLSQV